MAPRRPILLRRRHAQARAGSGLERADGLARRGPRPGALAAGEPRGSGDRHSAVEGVGMREALVNPYWTYDGSIYFGCRHPHLPLELGYSKALLERAGHEVLMLDGQLQDLDNEA